MSGCADPNCPHEEPHWHSVREDLDNPGNSITATHWASTSHVHEITPGSTLRAWWLAEADQEAEKLVPKAIEYGSYDLQLMGQALGEMTGQDSTVPHNMEQAIVFYLLGKIARAVSATRDGRAASDDTFTDIAIYAKMVLYIREHGRWP